MRVIDPALKTLLSAKTVDLYYAVEFLYDEGALRLWTGVGTKQISGQTYQGVGGLLGISPVSEGSDFSAKGATITLTASDPAFVSMALATPYQNRKCRILLGSGSVTMEVFSGFMDVMSITDGPDSSTISVLVESKLITLERNDPFRYTSEAQKSRFSDDTIFNQVADLADKQIVWGRKEA